MSEVLNDDVRAPGRAAPGRLFAAPGLLLYRRLLWYVRPYAWVFGLAVVGMMIVAAGDVLMAYMVMPIIQKLQHPDPVTTLQLPLTVVGVFLLRGLGSYMSQYGMAWTGHRVVFDLRRQMIDQLLALPTPYYDARASGPLISKVTFDAYQLAGAASSTITTAVRSTLTITGGGGLLLWLNWKLTLIAIIVLPLVAVVIRYFSRRLRSIARDVQLRTGAITQVLEEIVGGHRVVKLFSGELYERERAVAVSNRLRQSMSRQSLADAANSPIVQFLVAWVVAVIVYIMLKQSETGGFDPAAFAAYVIALLTLVDRLRTLSGVNANIQRGLAAAESIFGLLDETPEEDRGSVKLLRVRGEIVFDDVFARYAGTETDVLAGVSLSISPGESVALVGPSGSGKTTLVNLIPRFYEPTAGRILLDGRGLDTLTRANLRSHIALVSQDITLFDDTVAANIAYGAMAQAGRDAIERAAHAAYALEFIRSLPLGFATIVGENGIRLSGGQRQRLAIARAILKNAPILILDEATSALDSESERYVQAAIDALMAGRTTIVIAHRLSTIKRVDRIVVMNVGRVVEQGTHAELLTRDGLYTKLHRMQFGAHAVVAK